MKSESYTSSISNESNEIPLIEIKDPTLVKWTNFSDYRFVEYYLTTAFGFKIPYTILAIHNVKNEEILTQISEKKFQLWTYGWYQLKNSDYPEKIGILKTRGFIDKNKSFIVGSIPQQIISSFGHTMYFLLCKILIGHAICVKSDKVKEKKLNEKKFPPYYNSYKILTPENVIFNINSIDKNNIKGQTFQYEIFKSYSICPLYVVKIQQIKESIQRDLDNYYCSKCHQKEAEVFCIICESYYDKECFNIKHKSKGKNELSHGNYQQLKYKQKQGLCSEHENREAEYYCLNCKKPICSRCKIIVNNKINAHSTHQVKDIFLAYEENLPNFSIADEIRKRAIIQLKRIKQTVKNLIEKQIKIEKEIDFEFREENDSIQSLTKIAKLKHFSVIAELNEMKKHLIYMDNYFHNCEKAMISTQLKPEAIWIKDNYEEILTNIFSNFDEINLNYKVNAESFNNIKQTELRITKKIDVEKKVKKYIEEPPESIDNIIKEDNQYELAKKIVSLKHEKEEAKIKKDKQAQDRGKQDFATSNDPLKYILDERIIDIQKEITMAELKKEQKKENNKKNKN